MAATSSRKIERSTTVMRECRTRIKACNVKEKIIHTYKRSFTSTCTRRAVPPSCMRTGTTLQASPSTSTSVSLLSHRIRVSAKWNRHGGTTAVVNGLQSVIPCSKLDRISRIQGFTNTRRRSDDVIRIRASSGVTSLIVPSMDQITR